MRPFRAVVGDVDVALPVDDYALWPVESVFGAQPDPDLAPRVIDDRHPVGVPVEQEQVAGLVEGEGGDGTG